MNIQWRTNTGRYSSGESAFLGKWKIGGYSYSVMARKDDPNVWDPYCRLPGGDRNYPAVATEEDARNEVARLIHHWFDNLQ